MSAENELPDWLKGDEEPVLTQEEEQELWERFLKADLKGHQVVFANYGGDMWELTATIVAIRKTDEGVLIEVVDVVTEPQEDCPFKEEVEIEFVERDELLLFPNPPPDFRGGDYIVLCALANHEGFDIGLVFPPELLDPEDKTEGIDPNTIH